MKWTLDPQLMDAFHKTSGKMLLSFVWTYIWFGVMCVHLFWHPKAELIKKHCYEFYPNVGTELELKSS